MSEIYSWIKEILMIILSISLFQILVPDSAMAGYLKFLYSLIILAVILTPVIQLLNYA